MKQQQGAALAAEQLVQPAAEGVARSSPVQQKEQLGAAHCSRSSNSRAAVAAISSRATTKRGSTQQQQRQQQLHSSGKRPTYVHCKIFKIVVLTKSKAHKNLEKKSKTNFFTVHQPSHHLLIGSCGSPLHSVPTVRVLYVSLRQYQVSFFISV